MHVPPMPTISVAIGPPGLRPGITVLASNPARLPKPIQTKPLLAHWATDSEMATSASIRQNLAAAAACSLVQASGNRTGLIGVSVGRASQPVILARRAGKPVLQELSRRHAWRRGRRCLLRRGLLLVELHRVGFILQL